MRLKQCKLHIPQLLVLLLAFSMILSQAPTASAAEYGTCGDDLSWTLADGLLTITGSGPMADFPETDMAPWYRYREQITRISLPEGLTRVGSVAFYGCENLLTVTIPNSVTAIGNYAFGKCTGLQMLTLGSGVTRIGQSAFTDCLSLTSLSLPGSLTSIGTKAFYRCESIPTVTVPASVRSLGAQAFGYCKSLVRAEILAPLTTLPDFLFSDCHNLVSVSIPEQTTNVSSYVFQDCHQLTTVNQGGTAQNLQEIQQTPSESGTAAAPEASAPAGEAPPSSAPAGEVPSFSVSKAEDVLSNPDGSYTFGNVTVSQGENTTVTTRTETDTNGNTSTPQINVTVENENGWQEATDLVQSEMENLPPDTSADVNVYIRGDTEIDSDFVESLAGKNTVISVVTSEGSAWRIDTAALDKENPTGQYSLAYSLESGTQELNMELGTASSFVLRFLSSAQVESEVLIQLGTIWARQEATLFQRTEEGLTQIQTVVVDQSGYAHFFLAAVNQGAEYFVAMNLFANAEQEAIVPDEILSSYGEGVRYEPVQYEITGVNSSWGMSFGQVSWILFGVMGGAVVLVGVIMFLWNKRRLAAGYIPDLDEEDYM